MEVSQTEKTGEIQKAKILIVDDSMLNRSLLGDMLSDTFDIIEAENGQEAVSILHERELEISMVLLDIVMPIMDGFDVLAVMNEKGWIKNIPVIMISSETSSIYIDRAYDLGATDFIGRPFDERIVRHRVNGVFMIADKRNELSAMLSAQMYEKEKDNNLMIEILSHIVEFRNGESGLHVLHVHAITELLLKALAKKNDKYQLSNKEIRLISNASALHDIGKISIPSEILNKPGRFTREEFEIMKTHALEGAKMLDDIPYHQDEALVKVSYQICRWHHERWDGSGYPDGLKGDDIPIAAQVVALADVLDALTANRCYKEAFPFDKAVSMILNGECGVFNPELLECLKENAETLKKELSLQSFGHVSDKSIQEAVNEVLKSDGGVSGRSAQLLERERTKLQFLAEITHEITFEYEAKPEMIILSDWAADSLGLPVNIFTPGENKQWTSVFDKKDFACFVEKMKAATVDNPVVSDKYLMTLNGEKRWCKVIAKVLWSDDEGMRFEGAFGKISDINDETKELEDLVRQADCDSRTGLFNHKAAKREITRLLSEANGRTYALAVFDLDDFKKANDTYGHLFGDEVLEEVARRIKQNIRSSDIGARMGGDEFILFMEYKRTAEPQIKRIFKGLTGKYKDFDIGVSMGVACTDGSIDYNELFSRADSALYTVKSATKKSFRFYDDSMVKIVREENKKDAE